MGRGDTAEGRYTHSRTPSHQLLLCSLVSLWPLKGRDPGSLISAFVPLPLGSWLSSALSTCERINACCPSSVLYRIMATALWGLSPPIYPPRTASPCGSSGTSSSGPIPCMTWQKQSGLRHCRLHSRLWCPDSLLPLGSLSCRCLSVLWNYFWVLPASDVYFLVIWWGMFLKRLRVLRSHTSLGFMAWRLWVSYISLETQIHQKTHCNFF